MNGWSTGYAKVLCPEIATTQQFVAKNIKYTYVEQNL
jgi:hypothetical protein